MKKKKKKEELIPTKDIYLCQLAKQVITPKYDEKTGKFIKRVGHGEPFAKPMLIWAYKHYEDLYISGLRGCITTYVDVFTKSKYNEGNQTFNNSGDVVAFPIKPVIFNSKLISIEEARELFEKSTNETATAEEMEIELIKRLKMYAKNYPESMKRIIDEVLREMKCEENNFEVENTEVEEKGKVRKLTK